jgi:uncharacterized membrane protein YfcA
MIGAIVIGVAAGVLGGLLGLGGGVLFVPGLVIFLSLSQHQAEATSLLAIVPVALVGTITQDRYGNVRRRDALLMGVLSLFGVAGGVALANALSGAVLRTAFALLMLFVAARMTRSALTAGKPVPAAAAPVAAAPVAPDDPMRTEGP